jgi:hypothetical protein
MAQTPEDSEHTSVAERINQLKPAAQRQRRKSPAPTRINTAAPQSVSAVATPIVALKCETYLAKLSQQPLMPFDATARLRAAIPFAFDDYLDLVDSTGRCIRPDKRGAIAGRTPKLLNRLNIDPEHFIDCATNLMKQFGSAVGAPAKLTELCAARQVKYLRGAGVAKRAFEGRAA